MRRSATAVSAIGAVALVLAAWGGSAFAASKTNSAPKASSSPINVCQISAESGPFIQLGQNDIMGLAAYVKYINSHGGVNGQKYNVTVENDNSDPSLAASLVRKCVEQDHANFIEGPEETATMAAAIPVANSLHTVMITQGSGWNQGGVTNAEVHSYSFPGVFDVFYQDDVDTAVRLISPRHLTKVAVIQDGVPGGNVNGTYMQTLCKAHNCTVTGVQNLQPGQTDDTPQVLNLLSAKPDIIVLGLVPGPDTITALKAIRAQDPTIPVSECSGCWTPGFLQAAGGTTVMNNVYLIASTLQLMSDLPQNSTTNKDVVSQLKTYEEGMKAAGNTTEDDLNNGTLAWATGMELTDAIKKAGNTNANNVMKALQNQNAETLTIFWKRTPQNYAGLKSVVDLTSYWTPQGNLNILGG
jgi:ABC-type branched-subunit amino acid transport system substrate-binding protein